MTSLVEAARLYTDLARALLITGLSAALDRIGGKR